MRVTFVWEPSPAVPGDRSCATASRVDLTVLGEGDARPVSRAGAADRAGDGGGARERARPRGLRHRAGTAAPADEDSGRRSPAGRFRRARHHRSRSARQGGDRHAGISARPQRARVPHARRRSRSGAGFVARVQPDGAAADPVSRVCAGRSTAVRVGAAAEPHGTADADARRQIAGSTANTRSI